TAGVLDPGEDARQGGADFRRGGGRADGFGAHGPSFSRKGFEPLVSGVGTGGVEGGREVKAGLPIIWGGLGGGSLLPGRSPGGGGEGEVGERPGRSIMWGGLGDGTLLPGLSPGGGGGKRGRGEGEGGGCPCRAAGCSALRVTGAVKTGPLGVVP